MTLRLALSEGGKSRASRRARSGPAFALCLIPFIVLATLNAGGYRYGASDQAFYVPAVVEALDPAMFPRDTPLLAAQTKLTLVDETLAAIVTITGMSLPAAFALLYLVGLVILAAGAWSVASFFSTSRWTVVAFLAAMTLRHAIARSGTNTLEGYFHPRTLAFALGSVAVGAFLRGKLALVALALVAAASVHPTTALWFAAWLGVAAAIASPVVRQWTVPAVIVAVAASTWALLSGPLAGRLAPIDPVWRRLLDSKDYLFPLEWPAYAWILNLGYLVIIAVIYRARTRQGLVGDEERALVLGSSVLLAIFAAALVGHRLDIALSYQLQPARVFWMLDFLATIYAVWWMAEGGQVRRPGRSSASAPTAALVAGLIVAFSCARGAYVLYDTERPAVQLGIKDDDWGRVMAWARTTDTASGWLADPLHAVLYGTSVRVAGHRDVFVEAVKDAAIGMYSREVAVRTAEHIEAIGPFAALTAAHARSLATDHALDYLVTEQPLDLPLAFESGRLHVYWLR